MPLHWRVTTRAPLLPSSALQLVAALDSKGLFVTTFNMGEAPAAEVANDISAWIPEGYDVYAIGVQVCYVLPLVAIYIYSRCLYSLFIFIVV